MTEPARKLLEAADPNVNAAVSASAGTGKTWLLVARLLRLLLAGEKPGSILAITFTEKAAAEIRERLAATLREWSRADDAALAESLAEIGESAKPAVSSRARALYETITYAENDVRILTFHAFCAEILKRFPLEAEVPPGFEILSETWELQDEALNRLYVEAAEEGAESALARALETLFETCNGLFNTNKALRNFLDHRNDWLAYTEESRDAGQDPAHAATQRLSEMLGVTVEDAERVVTLDEQTRARLATHARLLARHPVGKNRQYATLLELFLAGSGEIDGETMPALLKCFFTADGGKRRHEFSTKTFKESLGAEFDEFTANLDAAAEKISALQETRLRRQNLLCNRAWYVAGQRLVRIYENLKRANRRLDFDDLEWNACRVLNKEADAQWIQYRLNEQIRHVLVDEFQDTNPQQWQLLKPLLEEIASQEGGGSAFIVGDAKQSIYGFRRASPELQDEAERWLGERMNGRSYTTDRSRRSSPAVIAFVNRVFGGEDDAAPLSGFRLDFRPGFRRHETALDTPGGVVAVPFAEKTDAAGAPEWRRILRDPPPVRDDHPAFEEGRRVAGLLRRMIQARVAVHDRDGKARPARYGDVTLLLRKRTQLEHYERALIEAGIPHGGGRAEKMFGSLEISDVLALLEFLVNYERNLNLAQMLRSPIFAAGDEQLITLSKTAGGCWFTRLARLTEDRTLERAHRLLGGWTEAARTRLPAHDLLDRVYREGDVIRRYRAAAPGGEADLVEKNLLDLLDYSLDFESGRYPDVAVFARRLKRRVARAGDPRVTASASGAPDQSDQVRILTIHQAKGLEAPIIILADTGKPRPPNDAYSLLMDWPAQAARPEHFLLVPKSDSRDEFTQECKRRLNVRNQREEANVLYVALTRARQYLIISGSGKDPDAGWYGLLRPHACEEAQAARQWETATGGDESGDVEQAPAPSRSLPGALPGTLPEAATFEITPNALVGAAAETRPGPSSKSGGKRSDEEDAQLRGQAVHYALKLLSERAGEDEVRNVLAAHFPQARGQLNEWIEYARGLINDEALRELFDDTRYEQVLNEAPVSFLHEGEQYFGVIDRLCVGTDQVWLVDYKTHAAPGGREEELKAHYAEQMRAYRLGVGKLWPGRAVRASLLLTETRRLCDYRFDEG